MKSIDIRSQFLIYTSPKHKKYKDKLLNLIDESPDITFNNITKTDWTIPEDITKDYHMMLRRQILNPMMFEQVEHFKADNFTIERIWFQQYIVNDFHKFHNHPNTNYTNVYFLELPNKEDKTQIKVDGKLIDYEVEEGQIITFPGHVLHAAPKTKGKRKTIISFNTNFLYA
jgi:hypothetical protein